MAVSKRLRYEVLRRDNHTCRYCGGSAPDVTLTVDHVVPVALGGSDDPSNLVAACQDCNSGKSATSPDSATVADVAQDALRWTRAMAAATELAEHDRYRRERFREAFSDVVCAHLGEHQLPEGWEQTCDQLVAAGLVLADFEDAAFATLQLPRQDDWRYFCGVMWTIVRQRQSVAFSLLASEGA